MLVHQRVIIFTVNIVNHCSSLGQVFLHTDGYTQNLEVNGSLKCQAATGFHLILQVISIYSNSSHIVHSYLGYIAIQIIIIQLPSGELT